MNSVQFKVGPFESPSATRNNNSNSNYDSTNMNDSLIMQQKRNEIDLNPVSLLKNSMLKNYSTDNMEKKVHSETSESISNSRNKQMLKKNEELSSRNNLGYEYSHDDGLDVEVAEDDGIDECHQQPNQPVEIIVIPSTSDANACGGSTPNRDSKANKAKLSTPSSSNHLAVSEEVEERQSNGSSESGFGTNDDELDLATQKRSVRQKCAIASCGVTNKERTSDQEGDKVTNGQRNELESIQIIACDEPDSSEKSRHLSPVQQLQKLPEHATNKADMISQQQQQSDGGGAGGGMLRGSGNQKSKQSLSSLSNSFRQKQPTRSSVYELHSDDIDNILNDNSSINSSSSSNTSSSQYRTCFQKLVERLTRFYYSCFCCYSTTSHTSHTPFIWSWLSIFCCCCPLLGGLSLYLTHRSKKLKLKQKYELAEKYSNYAEKLNVASLIIGIIFYAIAFFIITLVIFIYWKHTS